MKLLVAFLALLFASAANADDTHKRYHRFELTDNQFMALKIALVGGNTEALLTYIRKKAPSVPKRPVKVKIICKQPDCGLATDVADAFIDARWEVTFDRNGSNLASGPTCGDSTTICSIVMAATGLQMKATSGEPGFVVLTFGPK